MGQPILYRENVMRKILTWLTVLLLFTTGQLSVVQAAYAAEPARAPARIKGHRYCDGGIKDINILADRIAASLAAKPDGTQKIEGCRATPLMFLRAHQDNDPQKKLGLTSVDQLPNFYRTQTELVELPPGTVYWSACILDRAPGYLAECDTRIVGVNGEKVWRHKASGLVVMLGNCANPAGKPIPPEPRDSCDSRFIYLRPGEENRIGMAGRTKLVKSACLGIRRAGEKEFSSVLLDECPRENCNYEASARGLGLPVRPELQVSYVAEQEGWYELRFDRTQLAGDNAIIDCVIRTDGTQSLGMVTKKAQMYAGVTYLSVVPRDKLSVSFGAQIRVGAAVREVVWTNTKVEPPTRR